MNSLPTISVVTTVFNKEDYIEQTILSVVLAKTENVIEYIIIDDNSTDKSWEKISNSAKEHSFIRAIRNESNLGDYANRRKAILESKGDYIKFIDADDLLYAHSLTVFNHALIQFPNQALYLSWNMINPPFPFPRIINSRECFRKEFLEINSFLGVGPSAALIQRVAYDNVGGFKSDRFVGDTELWRSIALRYDICLLPPSLCFWRQHPMQESVFEKASSDIYIKRIERDLAWLKRSEHFFSDSEYRDARMRLSARLFKLKAKRLVYG
jgi:glycosyltransferase involved in cell wall biosynthesis